MHGDPKRKHENSYWNTLLTEATHKYHFSLNFLLIFYLYILHNEYRRVIKYNSLIFPKGEDYEKDEE